MNNSLYKKVLSTFNRWVGKEVDVDGYYSNQCADWTRQYAIDIWYPITTYGNAKDFAIKWLGKNWTRVTEPWIGDIVVFTWWQYGHIAVVEDIKPWILEVVEQNRNWKASSTTKWSPVQYGSYKITGKEVYFRPVTVARKSTNIKARPDYNFKNYPILDQWQNGECAWYSILACLIRMKDWVDYKKIEKELIAEKWNELTMRAASEWYVKKWYIKWIRKASYSKSLLKRQPLITQIFNANWDETNKPPYALKFGDRESVGSHWVCISEWVIANSHGENRYDKWYCYFTEEQRKEKMKVFYTLII